MPALNYMKISEGHQLWFLAILRTLLYDLAQIFVQKIIFHTILGVSVFSVRSANSSNWIFSAHSHFHFVCCHPSFVRGSAAAKMH